MQKKIYGKQIENLSGGQKTRVALGKLLISKPDILLLDEPTNHLDMESIAWLETYLLNYPGAVFIVSHDRYFLDKVVTKSRGDRGCPDANVRRQLFRLCPEKSAAA